jgi:hypothetical protein
MSSAIGILGWTPEVFWAATVFEYSAAMRGYNAKKGNKTEPGMTRNEFLAEKAAHEQGKKAQ